MSLCFIVIIKQLCHSTKIFRTDFRLVFNFIYNFNQFGLPRCNRFTKLYVISNKYPFFHIEFINLALTYLKEIGFVDYKYIKLDIVYSEHNVHSNNYINFDFVHVESVSSNWVENFCAIKINQSWILGLNIFCEQTDLFF